MPCLDVEPLSLISEPENRSVIVPHFTSAWDTVIQGFDEEQPDLACGHCGAVLVSGVARGQFISLSIAPPDSPLLNIPEGGYWIKKTLIVPPSFYVTVARRNLVIQCPRCWSHNEVSGR